MIYGLFIMLIIYVILYVIKFRRYSKEKLMLMTLLYFYVWLILFLTIIPKDFTLNPNWQKSEVFKYPFENLKPYNDFKLGRQGSTIDIILNLIMMIPFAFLFASLNEKNNFLKTVLMTFVFSLLIETAQIFTTIFLIYGRNFDITDIINNTIGGGIGYLIYKVYKYLKTS